MVLLYLAEISKHKGPPVFTEEERYKMVRAIKWVDEVSRYAFKYIIDQLPCLCTHAHYRVSTAPNLVRYSMLYRISRSVFRSCMVSS